jgi:transcriptional regulator with XRE-family HTH domain
MGRVFECRVYSVVICSSRRCLSFMDIREVFARNLRRCRQEMGLSQEALAHEAGVDRTNISALERSAYSASITMVDRLAKVLGVEPAALLRRPSKASRGKT